MNRFEKIITFVMGKHKGQVDKAGKPYIIHPLTVALGCNTESAKIVALCHDVLEDTDATVEELKEIGLTDEEVDAVLLLTKPDKEDYMVYVKRLSQNEIAREVKMSDLNHNMDLSRLKTITEKDLKRVEKYKKAYNYLKGYDKEILNEREYKKI